MAGRARGPGQPLQGAGLVAGEKMKKNKKKERCPHLRVRKTGRWVTYTCTLSGLCPGYECLANPLFEEPEEKAEDGDADG